MQNGDAQAPWQSARDLLNELQRENRLESLGARRDGFNPGRSAPGTEAWKQDFAKWDELKVQMAAALERAEQTAADRLRGQQANDRLNAGATQAVPDAYRRLVEKYYRALGRKGSEVQFAIALPWWTLLLHRGRGRASSRGRATPGRSSRCRRDAVPSSRRCAR